MTLTLCHHVCKHDSTLRMVKHQMRLPSPSRKTFYLLLSAGFFNLQQLTIYKYALHDCIQLCMMHVYISWSEKKQTTKQNTEGVVFAIKFIIKKQLLSSHLVQAKCNSLWCIMTNLECTNFGVTNQCTECILWYDALYKIMQSYHVHLQNFIN